jgi:hypothetical protein
MISSLVEFKTPNPSQAQQGAMSFYYKINATPGLKPSYSMT